MGLIISIKATIMPYFQPKTFVALDAPALPLPKERISVFLIIFPIKYEV